MDMERVSKMAKVAAEWWAGQIKSPGLDNFNMGEEGPQGGMAMLLGTMLAMDNKPSSENVEKFQNLLEERITEELKRSGGMYISCDYNPDWILSEIAEKTGINATVFPWKTNMEIHLQKGVKVSKGYGKPYDTLL